MDEHFYFAYFTLPEFDDIWRSRTSSRIKAYFMNFTSSYLVLQIEFLNWLTLAELESSSDQSLNKSTLVFTLKHHLCLISFHPGTFHPRTQNSQSPIDLKSKSVHNNDVIFSVHPLLSKANFCDVTVRYNNNKIFFLRHAFALPLSVAGSNLGIELWIELKTARSVGSNNEPPP